MPTLKKNGAPRRPYPPRRPRGLTETEAFTWFMPGVPPPPERCWDWSAATLKSGYGVFNMESGRIVRAHRASYWKFVGPIPDGAHILHSCDRPICVQPAHLSIGNDAENVRQSLERGQFPIGSRHGRAKLTEADVRWIRSSSGLSLRAMAAMLGVTDMAVHNARRGKTWKHVR